MCVKQRKLLWLRQHRRCVYCRREIAYHAATIDHVVPRSMGGRGGSNLVVACETCNSTKGSLPHSEFVNRFAELAKARADAKLQRRISRNRRRLAWSIALWLHKQEALYFEEQLEKLRAFRAERAEIHH
ncbi:MAG: HNH endonuclease [Planctomycetes bacterium]|nr:HNH endonuclease [Planctomycetota bacterium]